MIFNLFLLNSTNTFSGTSISPLSLRPTWVVQCPAKGTWVVQDKINSNIERCK